MSNGKSLVRVDLACVHGAGLWGIYHSLSFVNLGAGHWPEPGV